MLSNLGDGQLCHMTAICGESSPTNELMTYANEPSLECQFCEKVIDHWVAVWTANATEDEFKEVLEALCHKMAR